MLTPSALPFLPAGRALRRHRTSLQHELAIEPLAQLLPLLLSLPLGLAPLPDPAALLAAPRSLALLGPPNSGRSLALLQVAQRWAEANLTAPLLLLPLAELDAQNLTPRALVAGALHRAGLPEALAEGARPALLLVDDWELLPADRRTLWRAFFTAAAATGGAMRAVVALPEGECWPDLDQLAMPTPDQAMAAVWLAQLLPDQNHGALLSALSREPRAPLSLADLALLALIYPLAGPPSSRAELYEQSYALARPLLGERPPLVGRALLRHHRLARSFAGGEDLATLADLAPVERAAVAPLAAGLLDDPTPVLAALWGEGKPDAADLRALVACARERPARAPRYSLRLLERLVQDLPAGLHHRGRQDRRAEQPEREAEPVAAQAHDDERALLASLAPALPGLLAAAALADEPAARAVLLAADGALPPGPRPWLALVDDLGAPEPLRWAAADLLAAAPPAPEVLAAPPQIADGTTLAARFYVAALGPTTHSLLATPALRAGLEALLTARAAGERRTAAARAIVADPALPEELRAAALAAVGDRELLERSALSGTPALRASALDALGHQPPDEALDALGRALQSPEADLATRMSALDAVARLPLPPATGLLARTALDPAQPLIIRLHGVDLLAGRPGGPSLLRRLLPAAGLPDALRAAAAGHLGRLGVAAALPELRNALEGGPLPLRLAAAGALAALGARGELREECGAALVTGLRRVGPHTALAERVVRALGHSGAALALPALAALLDQQLALSLRALWLRRIPALAQSPAPAWPTLPLADDARVALMDALADGGTMADPPTSVAELTTRQATRIAVAAADALVDLGYARPDLTPAIQAALRRALSTASATETLRAVLSALAALGDPAEALAAILDDPAVPGPLRWLALEQLGRYPAARALLLRRLDDGADDAFVRGATLRLLGEHGDPNAVASLRRVARADDAAPQLRRAAVVALGRLAALAPATNDPAATVAPGAAAEVLAALAADRATPAELRVAAADALPAALPDQARATLRQAARSARPHTELAVALARALARMREHEALPALVRSAQGDHGAAAVASIAAIVALGDQAVAPLLVQISQSPTAAPGVKLAAVAALLRLGGAEYEPLLREYLVAAAPPLRMQAHQALAALNPDDPRLAEPLADPAAPLALRLQALALLVARRPNDTMLALLLARPDEEPQLRLAAATALATAATPAATEALAAALAAPAGPSTPSVLRHRCVSGLATIARTGANSAHARELLAALAADPIQPPEQRCWATAALLGC